MAVRIQLRRDTAANWVASNPVLRDGEIGIETDTLQFKIGNGSAWNSISNYANVVPSDLNTTLGDYVLVSDIGAQGGVVGLNNSYNAIIPGSSIILEGPTADSFETTLTVTDPTADRTITLPNADGTLALTTDITSAVDAITTDVIEEGSTNKYFTDERAQDAISTALAAGTHTNITVTYNDNANSISLAAAPGYVDEQAVDAVAAALAAGTHTNITVSYNDEANSISLTGATTYSDENAQDAIGNALGIGLSYNDTTGAISVDTATIQARVADVSDTEIGYLNGVTSGIQTQLNDKAPINNPTFTGIVTLPGSPSSANEAATKAYVDNITAGLNFHAAVHVATTTNLSATYNNGAGTLSASGAFPTIDGETITETQRVLVKSQSDAKQNGIYVLTDDGDPSGTWVLTRASDADNSPTGEVAYGDFVFVQTGSSNGGYGFTMTTTGTITLGTSNINWTQFNAGQSVTAGNGLTETSPGTIAIDTSITQTRVSGVSDTEIGYLDGVTSGIQTQLDAKIAKSDISAKGVILVGTGSGTYASQTVGTNGQVLTANSAQTDGVEWTTLPTTSSTTAITSNSAVTVDTVALTDFVSIEYQLTIKQGASIRSSKVLVQTDGTSVDHSEYGIVLTGTAITGVTVAASVSSTNMILQVTVSNAATTAARAFVVKNTIIGSTPAAPTIGTATAGDLQASVTFTPQDNGGSAITSYTVTSSPGNITATGSSSPIVVTGLTGLTPYTFTVRATNKYGTSPASSASNSATPTVPPVLTGGTVTSDATYFYRTFASTDTLGINSPLTALTFDALLVAGGGGGSAMGGGGGAGGVLELTSQTLSAGSYAVTVGAGGGGAAGNSYSRGGNGSNTTLGTLTAAIGGGTGASGSQFSTDHATSGGSGGGGTYQSNNGAVRYAGAGTEGQGFQGGGPLSGTHSAYSVQNCGGGGAGGEGRNNSPVNQGNGSTVGGIGKTSALITAMGNSASRGELYSSQRYFGGGGSAAFNGRALGGGGAGNSSNGNAGSGTGNMGGGGAGASNQFQYAAGSGGSGIVIIRYTRAQVGG